MERVGNLLLELAQELEKLGFDVVCITVATDEHDFVLLRGGDDGETAESESK